MRDELRNRNRIEYLYCFEHLIVVGDPPTQTPLQRLARYFNVRATFPSILFIYFDTNFNSFTTLKKFKKNIRKLFNSLNYFSGKVAVLIFIY